MAERGAAAGQHLFEVAIADRKRQELANGSDDGLGGRLGTIPGTIPSLVGNLEGCPFRARCHLATPACAAGAPECCVGEHAFRCIMEAA